MTECCAVVGPALYRAAQQTAVKEVTRPLPSLAERGVATQDYSREGIPPLWFLYDADGWPVAINRRVVPVRAHLGFLPRVSSE